MSRGGAPGRRRRVQAPLTSQEIARAAALKRFRTQNALTQEELADRLGVSQGSLSDWERARKPMPDDRFRALERIAEELRAAQGPRPAPEPPPAAGAAEQGAPEPLRAVPDPAELRANVLGADGAPPPGFGPAPAADLPPGAPAFGSPMPPPPASMTDMGLGIPLEVTNAQLALAAGPRIIYTLIAGAVEQVIDPTAGAIVGSKADVLAISLVQAGDVNPWFARAVQLMQVGPVANCAVLHLLVGIELVKYLRVKAKVIAEQNAQLRAEYAAAPHAAPQQPDGVTIHSAFEPPAAAAA